MEGQLQKGWPFGAALALALLGPPLASAVLVFGLRLAMGDSGTDPSFWFTPVAGVVLAGVAGWKSPAGGKRVATVILGLVSTALSFVVCFFWLISGG